MVSIFGRWKKEPEGRRRTRPTREGVRQKYKTTRRLAERASRSQKARILFGIVLLILQALAWSLTNGKYFYGRRTQVLKPVYIFGQDTAV